MVRKKNQKQIFAYFAVSPSLYFTQWPICPFFVFFSILCCTVLWQQFICIKDEPFSKTLQHFGLAIFFKYLKKKKSELTFIVSISFAGICTLKGVQNMKLLKWPGQYLCVFLPFHHFLQCVERMFTVLDHQFWILYTAQNVVFWDSLFFPL